MRKPSFKDGGVHAYNARSNSLLKAISAEIKIVANITIAGAITHGILSAMSKRCSILSQVVFGRASAEGKEDRIKW